jgi:hypothetical protein
MVNWKGLRRELLFEAPYGFSYGMIRENREESPYEIRKSASRISVILLLLKVLQYRMMKLTVLRLFFVQQLYKYMHVACCMNLKDGVTVLHSVS